MKSGLHTRRIPLAGPLLPGTSPVRFFETRYAKGRVPLTGERPDGVGSFDPPPSGQVAVARDGRGV